MDLILEKGVEGNG